MKKKDLVSIFLQIKTLAEEGFDYLNASEKPKPGTRKKSVDLTNRKQQSLDFDKPIRSFTKLYARGRSGPEKFVLLLCYLAKGDLKQTVSLKVIEYHWNKMKSDSLLGMDFNRSYTLRAKENDWVDSKKTGFYYLRPAWKDILS